VPLCPSRNSGQDRHLVCVKRTQYEEVMRILSMYTRRRYIHTHMSQMWVRTLSRKAFKSRILYGGTFPALGDRPPRADMIVSFRGSDSYMYVVIYLVFFIENSWWLNSTSIWTDLDPLSSSTKANQSLF